MVSFLLIRSVTGGGSVRSSVPGEPQTGFRADLSAGYRFIFRDRVLATLIMTIIIVALGTGSNGALEVFFISANLHVRSVNYGWMAMVFGAGMIGGALAGVRVGARIGYERMMWGGLVAAGACMIWYAKLGNFIAALALTWLIGVFVGLLTSSLGPILLKRVPNQYLGRVNSAIGPAQQVANVAAVLCAGWLVSVPLAASHFRLIGVSFGPLDSVMAAGGLLVTMGGIAAAASLELRGRRHRARMTDGEGLEDIALPRTNH